MLLRKNGKTNLRISISWKIHFNGLISIYRRRIENGHCEKKTENLLVLKDCQRDE